MSYISYIHCITADFLLSVLLEISLFLYMSETLTICRGYHIIVYPDQIRSSSRTTILSESSLKALNRPSAHKYSQTSRLLSGEKTNVLTFHVNGFSKSAACQQIRYLYESPLVSHVCRCSANSIRKQQQNQT